MPKLVGRSPVEVNINSPEESHIPIFDEQTRLWKTISTSSLFSNIFTGSNNYSGSITIDGDLIVSGSLIAPNITGSLLGTASNAISSSYASSGTGLFSGSFSGSFTGNGAGLTDIPATSVIGLNLSQIASGSVTASVDPTNGFRVNSNSQFTGSVLITGSLGVIGPVNISGSTGSVFSANVDTITYNGNIYQTGSYILTGSLTVFGGITGSLLGTSSYSLTASYIDGGFY